MPAPKADLHVEGVVPSVPENHSKRVPGEASFGVRCSVDAASDCRVEACDERRCGVEEIVVKLDAIVAARFVRGSEAQNVARVLEVAHAHSYRRLQNTIKGITQMCPLAPQAEAVGRVSSDVQGPNVGRQHSLRRVTDVGEQFLASLCQLLQLLSLDAWDLRFLFHVS